MGTTVPLCPSYYDEDMGKNFVLNIPLEFNGGENNLGNLRVFFVLLFVFEQRLSICLLTELRATIYRFTV